MSMLERIERSGVVAIVRLDDYTHAPEMARALADGGVEAVEFTYTNPAAGEAVRATKAVLGDDMLIGAGTVLDPETARAAILLGADFIVTPTVQVDTIRLCQRYSVPTVIGAFTPTEILTAWEAGASIVKVFPASVGGPRYLKDVRGPLPQVRLMPTGGVSFENAAEFIKAGAVGVAAGSNLVDVETVGNQDWATLTARARQLVDAVRAARN
ncbi:MAG TPA: bifunctional 4-hydroxy-2-oxoglutarate aldolase/2-dehydro-3-deoxy-phosphogluconate aldolase [Thermomicrobiales bacterium]|nr:bifunctional 4-hydroxy-2-oxoglutarate aldolase/2-dehydro-3-deoxy-phosphogluconate aldolase [Thermomicrobiales bacterium]